MALHSTRCPQCGVKINYHDRSAETVAFCQNCGHKFIHPSTSWLPFLLSRRGLGCMGLIVALAIIGTIMRGFQEKLPDPPPPTDRDRLQGRWHQVNGSQGWGYEFKGDTLIWWAGIHGAMKPKGVEDSRYTFTLNQDVSPKEITWSNGEGPGKTGQPGYIGIYKLEGDRLAIKFEIANPRPVDFSPPPPDRGALYIFEKAK